MTDIQQWRRMIQPSRARTPAVELDDPDTLPPLPTTPRKGLKPKLSSYFNYSANTTGPIKSDLGLGDDFIGAAWPSAWPSFGPYDPPPEPEVERLIESVMCRLLAGPNERLDIRFNGVLLQIFESLRNSSDEKQLLKSKLEHEIERRRNMEQAMQHAATQWEKEKGAYKAEVKRLEILLSEGSRGLAAVTLARQDSLLQRTQGGKPTMRNDKTLENIFEFLEKRKQHDDRVWNSQRAIMRKRPASPSAAMRRLSKTLNKKTSMTNFHSDLPFGTPPSASPYPALKGCSTSEESYGSAHHEPTDHSHRDRDRKASSGTAFESRRSRSKGDTDSTFSCDGDLLPDEAADFNLVETAVPDNDFVAIKRIAQVLAKKRHVDISTIMPTLLGLFSAQSLDSERNGATKLPSKGLRAHVFGNKGRRRSSSTDSQAGGLQNQLIRSNTHAADTQLPGKLGKHPRLKTKASEFFPRKFRPQLQVDTSSSGRRFSFEPGDDTNAALSASPLDALPAAVKARLLRKSVSASYLSEVASAHVVQPERPLSPVKQSPTPSAPLSETRRASRIPTPVYRSGSARPRQERDDSSSSLLTAIKHSDELFGRSDSMSGSAYSSPSASRLDLTHGLQPAEVAQPTGGRDVNSNPLLEHTNALRGHAMAVLAARAATMANADDDLPSSALQAQPIKRLDAPHFSSNSRRQTQPRIIADMGEPRSENARPMRQTSRSRDEDDDDSNATR